MTILLIFLCNFCVLYRSNAGQGDTDGNGIGDACESDYDGDGVTDIDDICPNSNILATSSFQQYISVELDPSITNATSPNWVLTDSVCI